MQKRLRIRAGVIGMIGFSLLLVPVGQANAQEKKPAGNSAIIPVPRNNPKNWLKRHEEFVNMAKKGDIEVLFLGDSITDAWGGEGHNPKSHGREIFEKEFQPLKAANFGIGGDRTQHVLWRLQHGELEGIHPKVVMLMIGTNNSNGKDNTAEEIAEGITAILKEIHKRSPQSKVLLLGIFPRDEKPSPRRDKIKRVNEIISSLDDGGKTVKYLDIGNKFVQPDDTISREIMPDFLHLTPKGYQLWADAVKEPINELLGKK
jgi:lysophospholipase L1-like esterase